MEIMKLVKLLYLSDRASFAKTGGSLTGDRMVSMPYGPVLSTTYNVMNGEGPRVAGGWDCWISDRMGHRVALHEHCNVAREKLTELSDADIALIEGVCAEFGRLGSWELSEYTHKHCPEWEDPHGSSYPITYRKLFRALGKDETEADSLAEFAQADDEVDLLFSRL